jgi:hypothetical protein
MTAASVMGALEEFAKPRMSAMARLSARTALKVILLFNLFLGELIRKCQVM